MSLPEDSSDLNEGSTDKISPSDETIDNDELGRPSLSSNVGDPNQERPRGIKIIGPNNEDIRLDDIVYDPPDGGYGWVIVFAAFMTNMIADGTVFSFGVLRSDIVEKSNDTPNMVTTSEVAWVGSMATGLSAAAGPLVSSCANIFGFRATAIAGAILTFFGLMLAWFFNRNAVSEMEGPNMTALYLCYGFLGGVGLCMLYVPSTVIAGFYFEKKRALAIGIALCGTGVGTFIYAPIVEIMIKHLGWPYTIMVEAFLLLLVVFCGALYKPLKPTKLPSVKPAEPGSIQSIEEDLPLAQSSTLIIKYPGNSKVDDEVIFVRNNSASGLSGLNIPQSQSRTIMYERPRSGSRVSRGISIRSRRESRKAEGHDSLDEEGSTGTDEENGVVPITTTFSGGTEGDEEPNVQSNRSVVFPTTITLIVDDDLEKSGSTGSMGSRVFRVASHTLNKPLLRSDIFYTGGLQNLENEDEYPNIDLQVSLVPKGEENLGPGERKRKCYRFPVLRKMLDFSLLKSLTFLLMNFSGICIFMALFIPFGYLADNAKTNLKYTNAEDEMYTNLLISFIGIANTFGRVLCGYVADKLSKYVLIINNTALTIAGIVTILVPFFSSYPLYVIYSVIFGLCVACFISLRSIIIVEVLGLNKLTNATGLLLLFGGIAAVIGTPIAGYLQEATESSAYSFYLAGGLLLLAGFAFYPLHYVNAWEKKRKQEKDNARVTFSF